MTESSARSTTLNTALAQQYQSGKQMDELAVIFGVHRASVATHLQRLGIPLRARGLTDEQLREAVALYAQGWSCQRLAERYSRNTTTVWKALQEAGVNLRAPWERVKRSDMADYITRASEA